MSERGAKGGEATKRKYATDGFTAKDVVAIDSLEDAKVALDQIRVAVLTRRITHSEGTAATRAVDSWVKAEAARLTKSLVGELQKELATKAQEIEQLRSELARVRMKAS